MGSDSGTEGEPTERNAYVYLAEHGPATHAELPNDPSFADRQRGVRKLEIRANADGDSASGGGQTNMVYYLPEHDPADVIRRWVAANETIVKSISGWALLHRCPEEFRDALREIIDIDSPAGGGGGGARDLGGTCPMCGGEYARSLAEHLPECGGEV